MVRLISALALAFLVTLPRGHDHATLHAEGIGQITVRSSFPVGGFPTARFQDKFGRVLYSMPVGSSRPDIFRIDEAPPHKFKNLGPSTLVFFLINSKSLPDSVLAIAMYTGGSDCEYVPALVGPVGSKLSSWLQQQPVVNGQGGFYVGDLGQHRGFGLAAWNFIWEDGAHWGSHRYNVRLYRIDGKSGASAEIFSADTKRKYDTGAAALKELGLQFDNILSNSPELKC